MKINKTFYFSAILAIAFTVFGCSSGSDNNGAEEDGLEAETAGDSKSTLFEVGGELFSIPSPIQTAILIKEVGSNYDNTILHNASRVNSYPNNFSKSLNLGIYGADLGYVTIYDQTQDAISYLGAVKKLANDLGISSTFDKELAERFERNIGKQDSLLAMVSDAFRATDAYLKNNDRNDVGVLVLTGGWIESLYFSTKVAEQSQNDEIMRRIGDQKTTCNNLLKLLMPYYDNAEYTSVVDQLTELNEVYKEIEVTYTYVEPTVDVKNKVTTINSKSDVIMSDDQFKRIASIIAQIRKQIIQ